VFFMSNDRYRANSPSRRLELLESLLAEEGGDFNAFPLTYAQKRLWFIEQMESGSAAFNMSSAFRLTGRLDVAALCESLNEIVKRHESLRTTFMAIDGQPLQIISPEQALEIPLVNLSDRPAAERDAEVMRLIDGEARQAFDLENGPLLRASILRLGEQEHVVSLTIHHIIADGWSISVFMRELAALYAALQEGKPAPLPELPIQYADYAQWEREHTESDRVRSQLEYWKTQFDGRLPVLDLPGDRPRPPVQSHSGARQALHLPAELVGSLKELSQRQGVTLFMTLLAAFQTLLHRYTNQEEICVGSPIAGRNRVETEGLIGLFLNTLVLRTDLSGNPTFEALLGRVREVALGAYANQELPVEMLIDALRPERHLSHDPLFQVMLILQNTPAPSLHLPHLSITPVEIDTATAKFDLTFDLAEGPQGIGGWIEYKTDLFDAATVARIGEHFRTLLEGIVRDPAQRIGELPLMNAAERRRLLVEWNDTQVDYPAGQGVHRMFEEQVNRTPKATALIFEGGQLSYADLNRRANRLARRLSALGVEANVPVGICLERSPEMIVALLATLKAGGAYVPLDPAYPAARLAFMLDDTRAPVVITQQRLAAAIPSAQTTILCLDADPLAVDEASEQNLSHETAPQDLAYIIYTSGSTGEPKGVKISHQSLAHFADAAAIAYEIGPQDRILQFASINFDTSAEEIYPCLIKGATLVLRSSSMTGSIFEFLRACGEHKLTVLDLPTAYWHEIALRLGAETLSLPETLRLVIIGGERALPERLTAWRNRLGQSVRLVNTYGPTETTVVATMCELAGPAEVSAGAGELPIGRPIRNAQTYVLDRWSNPVPIGIPGELYIGGAGLAAGYLNRPELTRERFVPDPFSEETGARLYRTGDLVRWRVDGQLEFLGRLDHQVKIRGFRVELGEVEAALSRHPAVSEAAVITGQESSDAKNLVAYIACKAPDAVTVGELQAFLKTQLPEYMMPSVWFVLDALPHTVNGKIDREALPTAGGARVGSEEAYEPPRTAVEEVLAGIWASLLGYERVGRHDHFFNLGGHSLLATLLISRVREAFDVEVPLRSVFEMPTVAGLAAVIEEATRKNERLQLPPIQPVDRNQELPLSFSQERLWLLHQLHPESVAYHVLRPLRIKGSLDVALLEQAITKVLRRHEVYRTTFAAVKGKPVQFIHPPEPVSLPVEDLRALPEAEREARVQQLIEEEGQRPFAMDGGMLWRLTLLWIDEQDYLLMLTEHHMLHDGWTEGRLVLDFLAFYVALSAGESDPLPELPIQYADFAHWQRACLQGEVLETLLGYWKKQLEGLPPALELPADKPRPPVQSFKGAVKSFDLPASLSQSLVELSRDEDVTLFMTLLAAFKLLLHRYTGQTDIVVGSPIANRNRKEIELLTGFFVNTLVMRTDLSGDPEFSELLGRMREVALGAYAHQDMPFEKLVEELQPDRHLNRQPLFQSMFVLQNAPMPPLELPGMTIDSMRVHNGTSKFDILVSMREMGDHLSGVIEYSTDIFVAETIERLVGHYQSLLQAVVENPRRRLSQLPLMTANEQRQLLVEWNDTQAPYSPERCIHQLFETQAETTPDALAVTFESRALTYSELNRRANQLARHLRQRGVGPEALVGICINRSPEMAVAVLGVLKAGGAYVPLDPAYPKERLAFMLEDSQAHVLLTVERFVEALPDAKADLIRLDSDWHRIAQHNGANLVNQVTADNLAYVTYTSGSTGRPKGIGMIQRPLLNLLEWMRRTTELPEQARTLQFASLSFDVSFQDMFSTWNSGGTVVMISEATRLDLSSLAQVLADLAIHRLFIPAVALQQLVEGFSDAALGRAVLKKVIAGSEQLQITQPIARTFAALPDCSLHNEYGPSETHVVTALALPPSPGDWPSRPAIGKPISNAQIYLLDSCFQPMPVGIPGELHIGGDGLARGYLGRPDLTADKFIPDPFSAVPGGRLYKTGDSARYLAGGNIEFLGRMDHQLKIRGFRIEPGEIEAALARHPAIQESVVLAWQYAPGDKRLVAYLALCPGSAPTVNELRAFLMETLPEYMVPSSFVILEALPLTPNGKVDRKRLPLPDQARPDLQQEFITPRNALESVLTHMYSQLLGIEQVGIFDNFFDLGGHSLLATQLNSRLCEVFQLDMPLRTIFELPTVAGLAEAMTRQERHAGELERIAQHLDMLNQLSEEEAEALLHDEQFLMGD
jgi:amino acid adenylation domain-containing protein